jgi:vancomycin resistance protein YoaR
MVIDSAAYYNQVHTGIGVARQGLGGRTQDEAIALITARVEQTHTQPITLVSGANTWTVTPDDVGQSINIQATASTAIDFTRKSNLIADLARRLRLYFNRENLPLIGEVDEEKFDAFLAQVAGGLDVKPVNAGLDIQGESIQPVEGVSGFVVDQDRLRVLLMDALFAHNTAEIEIPMMTKAPDVVADSTEEAAAQIRTMLSADLQLTYLAPKPAPVVTATQTTSSSAQATPTTAPQTTTTVPRTTTTIVETASGESLAFVTSTKTFKPGDIAAYLDYKAEDRNGVKTLVPYISAEKMAPVFSMIDAPMALPAVDAHFESDGASCWVAQGIEGKGLDREATAEALTAASLQTDNRIAAAKLKAIDPDFTTEEAHEMGIVTPLGTYQTEWKGTFSRQHNVRVATERISNKLVAPGEEFNFAKTLGPRTKEAGFYLAPGIVDGALEDVYGGGICQVSTTIFNAALEAGLKISERWNHSFFIDHYPPGRDATITGGGAPKNLRFVNDTANYIWIWAWSDGITTRFVIFGTNDGRKVDIITSERYNVHAFAPESSTTVEDPLLPFDSTTIRFKGQDAFTLKVTRHIKWPSGKTTSEDFLSYWHVKNIVIGVPTSTSTATTGTTVSQPVTTPTSPPGS